VPSYTAYLIETFATLLGVCALAFVVLWGARRLGVGRPTGPIELQGHLPLDARRAIYLIRVGPHVFIIGAGEGGFTKLGELPASELPALSMARESSFATVLSRVLHRAPERVETGHADRGLGKHSPSESE
jgi:flagellar biogenesis protein FliO